MRNIIFLLLTWWGVSTMAWAQSSPQSRDSTSIRSVRDIPYVDGGHPRQQLDLHLPPAGERLPLIVWVHGGAWRAGSKENCLPLRLGFVERGYAVASLNYRLSQHATFPAQIEDCKAAIRWLRAHSAEYGIAAERIGVWGSSAGGHLVALLGTTGDSGKFETGQHLDQSSSVQAVVDFYGPTDFEKFVTTRGYESHAEPNSPESRLIGGPVLDHPQAAQRANPIQYLSPADPPMLIVHGTVDPLVPVQQSEQLAEAAKQLGIAVELHRLEQAGHGGPAFVSSVMVKQVAAFFERYLNAAEGR